MAFRVTYNVAQYDMPLYPAKIYFFTQLLGIVLPSEYILCYPAAGYVTT